MPVDPPLFRIGLDIFAQWPGDRSRPTPEQVEEARKRYQASLKREDFITDFGCGLEFVMTTYSRFAWWKFFFPEEPSLLLEQLVNYSLATPTDHPKKGGR